MCNRNKTLWHALENSSCARISLSFQHVWSTDAPAPLGHPQAYHSWPHPLKGEDKHSFTKLVGWTVYPRVHRRGTVGRPRCYLAVDQIELKSQRRTGPQWWSVRSGINKLLDEVAVGVEALGFQREKRTIRWGPRLWRRKGRETRIRRRRGRKKRKRRGGQESGPLCFKREGKEGNLSCNFIRRNIPETWVHLLACFPSFFTRISTPSVVFLM